MKAHPFKIFLVSFTLLVSSITFGGYTSDETIKLIKEAGLSVTYSDEQTQPIYLEYERYRDSVNESCNTRFNTLITKFVSEEKLIEKIISTWALPKESENDDGKEQLSPTKPGVIIEKFTDGTKIDFDEESLHMIFNSDNELMYIYRYPHYAFSASQTYKRLFQNHGLDDDNECEIFFRGEFSKNMF